MPLKPITDPALERAEFKEFEKKVKFRRIVRYIYAEAVHIIKTTDKKSYYYLLSTYSDGWGDDVSEIIDALKKLFPTMRVELKVYTCSGGNANKLNCRCGGHQNCISIDWSKN